MESNITSNMNTSRRKSKRLAPTRQQKSNKKPRMEKSSPEQTITSVSVPSLAPVDTSYTVISANAMPETSPVFTDNSNNETLNIQIKQCIQDSIPDIVKLITESLSKNIHNAATDPELNSRPITVTTPATNLNSSTGIGIPINPTAQLLNELMPSTSTTQSLSGTHNNLSVSYACMNNAIDNSPTVMSHLSKPLALGVDAAIKSKIWAREYIELSCLVKNNNIMDKYVMTEGKEGVVFVKQKNTGEKIDTLAKWHAAFHIYIGIYCERHPSEVVPIMKYVLTIEKLANQASDLAAINYDKGFRQWRETCPAELPWNQVNIELYQEALASILQPKIKQNTASSFRSFRFRKYCYDYNNTGCTKTQCQFAHICQRCRGPHNKRACPRPKFDRDSTSNRPKGQKPNN
ncbi:hypothetical protein SNE40_004770 [Patella caerulea]|uniref:C3H1-type domain-containing protein n=1 Tax=Patella caerulea TaxID=87958 RepID=A0AAN8KA23_PATCE